jgi:catechol 2,3-dioxygenase-like lactoylglutathione lyase family enzyme
MPMSAGFNHVATVTADLDRVAAFYRSVFDAEVTFERLCCVESELDSREWAVVRAPVQMTRASSPNATATRRPGRDSTPSS